VEITGIAFALLRIAGEHTQEFNRWYDLDHMPEHVSKADVVAGRRYVAPAALREVDGVLPSDLLDGYPPYLTTYLFGGPLDFRSDEAKAGWRDMDRRIVKAGRFWQAGDVVHSSFWTLRSTHARPSIHVADPAVPHLAHRGLIAALGRAPSAERRQDAIDWWDRTHLDDLFAVPGIVGALRFDPVDAGSDDLLLHLILCEAPPAEVMAGVEQHRRYDRAVGRWPAHAGAYEPLAWLPFQRVVPLEYDFDVD
jgi:hypothetical protein